MQRRLHRNKKWEGGMLFGGTGTGDVVVWLQQSTYEQLGKPRKIRVDVHAHVDKQRTTVEHTHEVTYE